MENETEYLQPVIGNLQSDRFKRLTTCKPAVFHLTLTVLLELFSILLLIPSSHFVPKCEFVYLLLYAQGTYWFISLILDHYYKWRHHFLRLDGHFEFYEKVSKYATYPFYIISFCNAVLLVSIGILHNLYTDYEQICMDTNFWAPINTISGIISVQTLLFVPSNIAYILCVYNFNVTQPIPDVEKRECWILGDSSAAAEVGYRSEGEAIADLLQKQADLIYYYKCMADTLNNKIMELSTHVRGAS